jgi:outer membrane receptor protein involved in Fe transport
MQSIKKQSFRFLVLFIFYPISTLFSQTFEIEGKIIDESLNQPFSWVNVLLLDANTKDVIKGTASKDQGEFVFKDLSPNKYIIEVSFIGFQKKEVEVELSDSNIDLGKIYLSSSATALEDVVIVAEKPTLTKQGGKTVLNVSSGLAQSTSINELMENIPSVSVNDDGGVTIRGQKPILLIDGVEASSDEFNSLSPTIISSIEVQTSASAKYSGATVINVKLNSKSYQKQLLKVGAMYGTDNFFKSQLNASYKKNKFSILAGGNYQYRNIYKHQHQERVYDYKDQILLQDKIDTVNQQRSRIFINSMYILDENNKIGLKLNYSISDILPNSFSENRYTPSVGKENSRITQNSANQKGYSLLGFWNHTINDRSGLDFKLKFNSTPRLAENINNVQYENTNIDDRLDKTNFDETKQVIMMKIDYYQSFKKNISLEAGSTLFLRNNSMISDVWRYNYDTDDWINDENKSYNYIYTEQFFSNYISGLYRTKNWKYSLGMRLEYIVWESSASTSSVKKTVVNPSPIVNVIFDLNKHNSFNLGLSRRLEMPGYKNLNPHIDKSNPDVIRTGNPNLNPPIIFNLELGYSYSKNSFTNNLSFFYKNHKDKISRVLSSTLVDNVFVSKPENISNFISYGIDISQRFKLFKIVRVSTYLIAYRYKLESDYLCEGAKNRGIVASAKINSSINLPYSLRVGVSFNYVGEEIKANGSISPYCFSDIAVYKKILENKLQFSFKVNDVFGSRKNTAYLFANGSYAESDRYYNSRMFLLGISCRID